MPFKIKDFNGDTIEIVDDARAVLEFLAGTELIVESVDDDADGFTVVQTSEF